MTQDNSESPEYTVAFTPTQLGVALALTIAVIVFVLVRRKRNR